MGQVLQFPVRTAAPDYGDVTLDLFSAVDFALRDLADLIANMAAGASRDQAEACHAMLERAYLADLASG